MAGSIYDDKLITPTNKMLEHDLLDTKEYLDKICSFIETNYREVKPEWKFYNKKSGWILKLFNKKRNVLFVVPCQGYFRVAFVFGGKAENIIQESKTIPDIIKTSLEKAKKYMEGKIIEIDVKTLEDCKSILALIIIKLTN